MIKSSYQLDKKQSQLNQAVLEAKKILIVEDERPVFRLINKVFAKEVNENRYKFYYAANGREALRKIDSIHPDLILLDIELPEMKGLDMLDQLNQRGIEHKTVVISAYDTQDNFRHAMRSRVRDFLVKPIDRSDLEATVTELLKINSHSIPEAELISVQAVAAPKVEEKAEEKKNNKVTYRTVWKLAKQLPAKQQNKLISSLLEKCDLEQVQDLQYELLSIITMLQEEERERELIEIEDRNRASQGLFPLALVLDADLEIREKIYDKKYQDKSSSYYSLMLRWKEPDTNKIRRYTVTPELWSDEQIRKILLRKFEKKFTSEKEKAILLILISKWDGLLITPKDEETIINATSESKPINLKEALTHKQPILFLSQPTTDDKSLTPQSTKKVEEKSKKRVRKVFKL